MITGLPSYNATRSVAPAYLSVCLNDTSDPQTSVMDLKPCLTISKAISLACCPCGDIDSYRLPST